MTAQPVRGTPLTRATSAPASITAKFFRGLGDPTRIRILQLLEEGEMTVSELMLATGTLQGRLSSHLACLRWCGFVTSRRKGRQVLYRLTDERVRDILRMAGRFLDENSDSVEMCRIIDACAPSERGRRTSMTGQSVEERTR